MGTQNPASQIKPMPFPGESPTVALALAAGSTFGLQPEEKKKKPARASAKRKPATSAKDAVKREVVTSAKKSAKGPAKAKAADAKTTQAKPKRAR